MGKIGVGDGQAAGPQVGDDALHLHRVPQHRRVRQQAQATGLVHHHLVIAGAELALVGEEQPTGQGVAGFAAVELGLDQPAERRVVQVAQDVARLDQPAERG